MSQGKLCHLCVKSGQEHRSLYNEDGDENENYELIMKYFNPKCLFRGKELELTTVCLSCWNQIYGFYNFQESVYQAQKNLLDNSKDILILEIGSPQEGNSNELIESPHINIKTEQEFLSEDDCVVSSENKYEPNEGASVALNKEICTPVQEYSAISLPKLEIMDVHSNDNTSDDALSDEYDDQDVSDLHDDSIDHSMDVTPAEDHAEGNISKHSWLKAIKESDDFIAKWKQNFECELCSEKCTTYSVLQQHFQDNHPLDKFYVTCCQQRFHRRYYLEDHIRHHFDPNAFKCGVCKKDFAGRYLLAKHIRTSHKQTENGVRKSIKSTRISSKELDKLVAQWMPTLECLVCKKMSPTLQLLQRHFRQHHPQKQFQIECCDRRFKKRRDIEYHIRLHIEPKMFRCDLCYKEFNGKGILNAHMRSQHSEEANVHHRKMRDIAMDQLIAHPGFAIQAKVCLECDICSEKAPTYSLLRQHFQAKHPQDKFYLLCCKQMLYQRYRIENHVRRHIDPNAFKCDLCHKKFKESRNLFVHKRSLHNDTFHEAKKSSNKKTDKEIDDLIADWRPNLECVVCKQVCNTLTLLQHHFRENHPRKQFQIECCQRMFKRRYVIHEHIRLHINPDAFKCELCSRRFNSRTTLLLHMRTKHPSSGSE